MARTPAQTTPDASTPPNVCMGSRGDALSRETPLATYRKRVSELLASNEGPAMRRRNATDVETAFDDVKRNRDFRRLAPWGLGEVSREWRLLMMGRNMVKPPKAVSMSEKPTL